MTSPHFFKIAAGAATVATLFALPVPASAADAGRQYYELRIYSTASETHRQQVNDYWQTAGVPAYNRAGIRPIGVFTEAQDSPTNKLYVLIPFESLEAVASLPGKLAADADYQNAAAGYLDLTKSNAAYLRLESSLLSAFDGMKRMELPAEKKPEVFELRTYLSPSEGKGNNKVKMFNDGEITVMKEVGLAPIFYGQILVGSPMPSLVYLTCGENMEEHRKHWQAFSAAPAWKKLLNDPQYKDNMTSMIRVILKRTSASQF